jgi:hypothetical protein
MSPPDPTVYQISGWRRAVLWPLAAIAKLWGSTLRFELTPECRALLEKNDQPIAFVLWHNRLFLAAEVYRRYRHGRRLSALISASKDGAWLAAFFSHLGMNAVRGSSSRFGREAAGGMIDALRAGADAGITPDGPRGPCYRFKSGALVMTRATGTTLLLLGCGFSSAWRLRSWDRFYLPRPFSTLRVRCELVPPALLEDRENTAQHLEARLIELSPD